MSKKVSWSRLIGQVLGPPDGNAAPAAVPNDPFDLDSALLRLSPADVWTLRDSFEGTQIFGSVGSGKTSGSGASIARAFLRQGFGGLVLAAKRDEADWWRSLARETGRSGDLLTVDDTGDWRFNFLDYEANRPGGGQTENIVQLFLNAVRIEERGSRNEEGYWQKSLQQLLRNAVELVKTATGTVSLMDLHRVISSAPLTEKEADSEAFYANGLCGQLLVRCARMQRENQLDEMAAGDFQLTKKYWTEEFPRLAERTRSIVVSSFTTQADGLLRGFWRKLFCEDRNFGPEDALAGKVVVLDLPVQTKGPVGLFAQLLVKHVFQQAWQRRNLQENRRPVFLWIDEAQQFLGTQDREFAAIARSSRVATVLLTQNVSNYYAGLKSQGDPRSETDALLGCLSTKIFHANGDKVMNEWAAETIGKSWQYRASVNYGESSSRTEADLFSQGGGSTTRQRQEGGGFSQDLNYDVLPQEFLKLRKPGAESGWKAEAIVVQSGRTWKANGRQHLRCRFSLNLNPS